MGGLHVWTMWSTTLLGKPCFLILLKLSSLAGQMGQWLRVSAVLWEDTVCFLAPIWGNSQLPVPLAVGNPTVSSGLRDVTFSLNLLLACGSLIHLLNSSVTIDPILGTWLSPFWVVFTMLESSCWCWSRCLKCTRQLVTPHWICPITSFSLSQQMIVCCSLDW